MRILCRVHDRADAELIVRHLRNRAPDQQIEFVIEHDPSGERMPDQSTYDVMLVDHHPPQLDALDVLDALAAAGCDVPLVLLVTPLDEQVGRDALERGAAHYVVKFAGFHEQLAQTLELVVDRAKLRRQEAELRVQVAARQSTERRCDDVALRESAAALLESERRYRAIFEAAPMSVWEVDFSEVKLAIDRLKAGGIDDFRHHVDMHPAVVDELVRKVRILDVNDTVVKQYQAKDKAELLSTASRLYEPGADAAFREYVLAIANGGGNVEIEVSMQTVQGERFDNLIRVVIPGDLDGLKHVLISSIDITTRKRAEVALRKLSARLLHLQDEERRRIASELHDVTAQNLVGITLGLERLPQLLPDMSEQARLLVAEMHGLGVVSLREIRTLSYLLHPPLLDQLGLKPALEWFIDGFVRRSGIEVDPIELSDLGRLPSDVETALFRIVQESLTNVHRHSGSERASIKLVREKGQIVLEISDQGKGIELATLPTLPYSIQSLGIGILGMHERIRQLDGSITISSGSGGTLVRVLIPV
jgi:signal transduction histidine kinase